MFFDEAGTYTASTAIGEATGVSTGVAGAAVLGSGLFGYGVGTYIINPLIEADLSDLVNNTVEEIKSKKKSKEEAALNKEKNGYCKGQDIITGNKCVDAKSRFERLRKCLALRIQYKSEYGDPDGKHGVEIANTYTSVKNAENNVNEACKNECPTK